MCHVWETGEMHTGFCWGCLREKNPLARPSPRWKDNIKVDLQEVGWGGRDWIDLAEDGDRWPALVNTVMNLRVP